MSNDNVVFLEEREEAYRGIIFLTGVDENEDCVRLWEFFLNIQLENQKYKVPVVVFEGEHATKVLNGRFVWGEEAQKIYRKCAWISSEVLKKYEFSIHFDIMDEFIENMECRNVLEHQILRAGKVMSIADWWPTLNTQGDDVKRYPVESGEMYRGRVVGGIDWGCEDYDIVAEVCMATGANIHAWLEDRVRNKNKGIVLLNTVTISIESMIRVLPFMLENGIKPIVFCWGGIFNLYKKDLVLINGQVIKAGTLISRYADENGKTFMSKEMYDFIQMSYPVEIKPDICGEVGEKISIGHDRDVVLYDLLEFYSLGVDLTTEPWRTKIEHAINNIPGLAREIQAVSGKLYKFLIDANIIVEKTKINIPRREIRVY